MKEGSERRYNWLMRRAIFIGQAMPRFKRDLHDWPSLNSWLYSINIPHQQIRENFFYSALVDYFPGSKNGSHKIPTKEEVEKERERLINSIVAFNPEIVVPVGRLSISYCLAQKVLPLKENVGKVFYKDPYLALGSEKIIIPFPHPSGASTWYNKKENKELHLRSLLLLKENLI